VPGPGDYGRPAAVRVTVDGSVRRSAPVVGGAVDLGATLRGRSFRLDVTRRTSGARLPGVAIAELSADGLRPPRPRRSGALRTRCGALELRAVGTPSAPLAVSGSVRALDVGDFLRVRGCGRPLTLPAGSTLIGSPPATVLRADRLMLRSAATQPLPPAAPPGRIASVSGQGPLGVPSHASVAAAGPSWLVLGQSWSRGWRASCRDAAGRSRDLGTPTPIDGFANGWRIDSSCRDAEFAFPPQRVAVGGYALSALAVLACLVVALVAWRRERRRPPAPRGADASSLPDPHVRLDWRPALVAAAAVGVAGGFVFALRAGAVLLPLTLLAVRRGIGARRLVALALAAVALLPLVYLVFEPKNRGGFSFTYVNDLLGAHWVAVFAVTCLTAAAGLMAREWRRLDLGGADHAVPRDELTQQRDAHEEREPWPVARLDAVDP
jgi:hypothetical protein